MNSSVKKSLKFLANAKFDDAIFLLKKVLRQNPNDIQALNVLGQVHVKLGDYSAAIPYLARSIGLNTVDQEILFKLAYSYEKTGDTTKAIEFYNKTLQYDPNHIASYDGLGRVFARTRHNYQALPYFMKVLNANPNDPNAHCNIACTAKDLGLYDWTLKHYKIAWELDPDDKKYLSCILFNSHKDPQKGFQDFYDLAVEYSEKFVPKPETNYADLVAKRLDPTKTKLRLGFVSADLRRHPVSYYLLKVLSGIDRDQFELVFYHHNTLEDDLTQEYKTIANDFYAVSDKSDKELAELILEDEIDILFDMSGFTAGNRLGVFRYCAAPVQVTHMGYFGTVGMKEMDFILTDGHLVKEGEDKYFMERVYRMDHCCMHCDSFDLPAEIASEPPFVKNGYITFGSMNGSHKISPQVFALWARILKSCENAKLLIDNRFCDSPATKEFIERRFEESGVSKERLIIRNSSSRQEFLAGYKDIDIALDSFPYGGATTTIESLMMSVPVITVQGDRWMGRLSEEFLIEAGHEELVASDLDDYHDKAVDLVANKDRILEYKSTLRNDLQASELKLEKHIIRYQQALQDMWQIKSSQKQYKK